MKMLSRKKARRGDSVEVKMKDGERVTGYITEWGASRLTIITDSGTRFSTHTISVYCVYSLDN